MSKVLDRPIEHTRLQPTAAPVAFQPRVRVEPQHQPAPAVRTISRPVELPVTTPVKVRRRSKVGVGQILLAKTMLFSAFFAASYVGSTLAGHYLVEKTRNQSLSATARANSAVQAEREVQRRLDVLTSASSIEEWALTHAFRPTDGLGQTSRVVNVVASTH